jgi:N-acyl-D-amino-acid deacylase
MSGASASRFGFADRGVIAEGKNADLVVFDAGVFEDAATYDEPLRPPPGVRQVLVSGVFGVRDGVPEAVRAGRFVRR